MIFIYCFIHFFILFQGRYLFEGFYVFNDPSIKISPHANLLREGILYVSNTMPPVGGYIELSLN